MRLSLGRRPGTGRRQRRLGVWRRLRDVATPAVYRTERGLIWRLIKSDDGGVKVEMLKDGVWVAGRIGMVGLRLSPSTTRLTSNEIRSLPE